MPKRYINITVKNETPLTMDLIGIVMKWGSVENQGSLIIEPGGYTVVRLYNPGGITSGTEGKLHYGFRNQDYYSETAIFVDFTHWSNYYQSVEFWTNRKKTTPFTQTSKGRIYATSEKYKMTLNNGGNKTIDQTIRFHL